MKEAGSVNRAPQACSDLDWLNTNGLSKEKMKIKRASESTLNRRSFIFILSFRLKQQSPQKAENNRRRNSGAGHFENSGDDSDDAIPLRFK